MHCKESQIVELGKLLPESSKRCNKSVQISVAKLWDLIVCETDKLIDDKENVLSPVESETELQVCIYFRVGDHASVCFEGHAVKNATPSEWSDPINTGPKNHSRKKSPQVEKGKCLEPYRK